jgi:hypothetical protein
MITLTRNGKEVAVRVGADGLDATFELLGMLIDRREKLQIGDAIHVTRV